MKEVNLYIKNVLFETLLATMAFDSDWPLPEIAARSASAVIPPKTNRKVKRDNDKLTYKWRV